MYVLTLGIYNPLKAKAIYFPVPFWKWDDSQRSYGAGCHTVMITALTNMFYLILGYRWSITSLDLCRVWLYFHDLTWKTVKVKNRKSKDMDEQFYPQFIWMQLPIHIIDQILNYHVISKRLHGKQRHFHFCKWICRDKYLYRYPLRIYVSRSTVL